MCLGVPARILDRFDKNGLTMAHVDFGGVKREVCLDYIPQARVGDYCIVHVGFAISLLSEDEARETLALLQEITEMETESTPSGEAPPR
jgi:hydrogenase expression/formation protein HypC